MSVGPFNFSLCAKLDGPQEAGAVASPHVYCSLTACTRGLVALVLAGTGVLQGVRGREGMATSVQRGFPEKREEKVFNCLSS